MWALLWTETVDGLRREDCREVQAIPQGQKISGKLFAIIVENLSLYILLLNYFNISKISSDLTIRDLFGSIPLIKSFFI